MSIARVLGEDGGGYRHRKRFSLANQCLKLNAADPIHPRVPRLLSFPVKLDSTSIDRIACGPLCHVSSAIGRHRRRGVLGIPGGVLAKMQPTSARCL